MPFDKYKIKLVDGDGSFLGYKCELCGKEIIAMSGRHGPTASSAMTNHIKSKHPKEYEENFGHPPIWRYKDWEHKHIEGKWVWVKN